MVTAPRPGCRSTRRTSRRSPTPSRRTPTRTSTPDDLFEVVPVDAVVSARDLTLDLAEELERLAPFGLGNPDVTLLVPATEAVTPATVGDGKHLRFRVRQHGRDAGSAIAFGQGSQLDRLRAVGLLRRRVPAEGEPLERHGRAAARRPADLRHGRGLRGAASVRSPSSGARGEPAWTPEARRVFGELALDEDGGAAVASSSSRSRSERCSSSAALPRAA